MTMPYALRNAEGQIVALTADVAASGEFLPAEHPDVLHFLTRHGTDRNTADLQLLLEDLKMIRVIEDVIDLLIAKNVIIFSDLPDAVQRKIIRKRGSREKLFGSGGDIIGSEEGIL